MHPCVRLPEHHSNHIAQVCYAVILITALCGTMPAVRGTLWAVLINVLCVVSTTCDETQVI